MDKEHHGHHPEEKHPPTLEEITKRLEALEAIVVPVDKPPGDATVSVFYKRQDGSFEEHKMAGIDAEEAIGAHPDNWMREAPHGAKVVAAGEGEGKAHVVVPPGSVRADGQAPSTGASIAPPPVITNKPVEPPTKADMKPHKK